MSVKLTFNKPASMFMVEPNHKGIKIAIGDEGGLSFKTVAAATGEDVARIEHRSRGGFEVTIEGTAVEEVRNALNNVGPFYLLTRASDGWFNTTPYTDGETPTTAPPKFDPHVRLWDQQAKPAAAPQPKVAPRPQIKNDGLDAIREAYALLSSPSRAGRPSNEDREARASATEVTRKFEELASVHLNVVSDKDIADLTMVRDVISGLLSRSEQTVKAETVTASRAPQQSAPRKAKTSAPRASRSSEKKTQPVVNQTTATKKAASPSNTTVTRAPRVKKEPAQVVALGSRRRVAAMSKSRRRLQSA